MEFIELKNQDFTILGKGLKLSGQFDFAGKVRICCELEGKVKIEDSGSITIENSGHVKGDIYCNSIEIFGTFEGNIYSSGLVILRPACHVTGKIEADNLTIYPGAVANITGLTN